MLTLIASLTIMLTPACGQVDPMTNSAVWQKGGHWYAASYTDMDRVEWSRKVPGYINTLATKRKGQAVRKGCA